MYVYIYIYILTYTHTHTHTHIYIGEMIQIKQQSLIKISFFDSRLHNKKDQKKITICQHLREE